MGLFLGLKNFGSKILNGLKKTAGWVAPTLSKVMSSFAGPLSTLYPGIGGIMGTVGNIAGKTSLTEELYQIAQSLGKIYSASEYDVFKIFEALIDDKELDDEQKQFYEERNGENIYHYPAIAPVLAVLLHPKKIEELPVFSTVLAILKPSSQLLAVGFIQIFPKVALPLKDNHIPLAELQIESEILIHQLYDTPVASPIGLIYTEPVCAFGNNYYMLLYPVGNAGFVPSASNMSLLVPPVLINLVAKMFPSQVNYYGWT
ncbi:MAG: hypothetical protein EZS28_002924 [Streblomastix strix]|uniref:Uncharacterized protein n=1 Tax=Streblomastix strix TaxID=222440 RepID=A0A5J4X3I3_9EUKA|nr:MAG: hypothetical protein EZS28_002924 [Streblomastix strix]